MTTDPKYLASVSIPSRRVGDLKESPPFLRGGQVSIPSRRVGDQIRDLNVKIDLSGFHPLKAGRRPTRSSEALDKTTAFPSPQGGSETVNELPHCHYTSLFPSPQGGSETGSEAIVKLRMVVFPSPQGGSETEKTKTITIRVDGFHPLKAGRRLLHYNTSTPTSLSFHPLKAGRRRSSPQGNQLCT